MTAAKRLALQAALSLLTSCMVGPDYHRPRAILSLHYKELAGWQPAQPLDAIPKGAWWTIYGDPQLDRLESGVVVSNQNVRVFEAQYREAQAVVQEARAQLFPTLTGGAGDTRSFSGGGQSSPALSAGTASRGGRSHTVTQYTFEASASWDIDLWGRIRRQVQSDVAAAQLSAADLQNATLSAQANLAIDYVALHYEDSLRDLLQATVAADEQALTITRNQVEIGTASPADEAAAETQLETVRASLVNVGVARGQFEHAIAVLAGLPPADLSLPAAPLVTSVPVVPAGLPSMLLERRPDIAAAERAMDEENALVGVQIAAFFPSLTLSTSDGWAGGPIGMLISAANRVWSLGANASETIFAGGARSAAVEAAQAAYDASVANYRQTVLSALQQVEDELVALRVLEQQARAEGVAVKAAERALTIALNQYQQGTVVYTAVLTQQTALLADQETALSIEEQRLIASITLIEALGGGWDASDLPSAGALQRGVPFL